MIPDNGTGICAFKVGDIFKVGVNGISFRIIGIQTPSDEGEAGGEGINSEVHIRRMGNGTPRLF